MPTLRHSRHLTNALWLLLATSLSGACGGVAKTGSNDQPAIGERGAGGTSGATESIVPSTGGATVQPGSSGGDVAMGGTGGTRAPDGVTAEDAGSGCHDVFSPMDWSDRCSPLKACVNLDSGALLPASEGAASRDGGAESAGSVDEMSFCGRPFSGETYLFAFEESGATYDGFNVATGDASCEGRSLAYLGIGGLGDAPLTPMRTHCISVSGSDLGTRLAIVANDPSARIANLRAVSSCPCAYPIPYNVNTCPSVEGSAGHPNCG